MERQLGGCFTRLGIKNGFYGLSPGRGKYRQYPAIGYVQKAEATHLDLYPWWDPRPVVAVKDHDQLRLDIDAAEV